jgi:hypothetical protein
MTATDTTSPVRTARPALPYGLEVEREGIVFRTVRPGFVLVEVTFRNAGPHRTGPTLGILRTAPLGAFVPWQPVNVVQVPSLEPGESVTVTGEYRYATPQPLGSIDRIPPERVLTALGLGEPDRDPRPATPVLAADMLQMLQQGGVHWAGNLNLFFPGADVERHVAQALRVYPGRVNLAMFIVGDTADVYQFRLTGDADAWNARLFDARFGRPIVEGLRTPEVPEDEWHQPASGLVLLSVEPPPEAEAGAVNVHVVQRSSGREAVVEFTMDSRAAGPGCYKL